jgi:glycerophosphoryl diester phosphodiesterase
VQGLAFAVATPVLTEAMRFIVSRSGEPVVSNFDIAEFVLSPAGIVFMVILVALGAAIGLAGSAGQAWISGRALLGAPASAASAIAAILRYFPALVVLAARVCLRLMALALPFLGLGAAIWFGWLADHDVNYYLAEEPPEWRRALALASVLAVGYALIAVAQLARYGLALPVLLFERASPLAALAESTRRMRGRTARLAASIVAWWLLVLGVALALAWVVRPVTDLAFDWAGVDFRRVLPLVGVFSAVALAVALAQGAALIAGPQYLAAQAWHDSTPDRAAPREPADIEDPVRARRRTAPYVLGAIAIGVASTALAAWRATQAPVDPPVQITAHRGASAVAPENTLAAFRAAMEAGADYAELDVQRARDGTLIVMHDRDFMRMAGDPRRLADIDGPAVAAIDIGHRRGSEFAGETAPTLDAVIALVRGRMKLNVELKYNAPDPALAPAVVELLRRERFLDEAVISSLDARGLRQVRELEPRLRTGLIVTAAVGDVARTGADFVSLNAARATPSLIRRAHAAGKEVHVWTINRPDLALRMVERGADNLITDDPALIRRVLDDRAALSRGEQLALRLRLLFDRPPHELEDPAAVPVL